MRRTFSALSALLFALALAVVPAPAYASPGVPLPGPVDEIPDIPSRVARSVTGSPIGDATARDFMYAMRALANSRSTPSTAVATVPKPITPPTAFARAAGGSLLAAAMGSWAIGANGTLVLLGVANGTDYETVFCAQPDWYQATTAFVNMGFAPECVAEVPFANADMAETLVLEYGGVSRSVVYWPISGGNQTICVHGPRVFSPLSLQAETGSGVSAGSLSWASSLNATQAGWCGASSAHITVYPSANGPVTRLFVYNTSTSTVVADAVVSRADPFRTPRCSIEWDDGTTTTGEGTPYRESEGLPLSPAGLGCATPWDAKPGAGTTVLPSRIGVESEDDVGAITEISESEVPEFGPDERKAFDAGNGRGLVLEKVVGTTVVSCMTWAADCSDWWADSSSGTVTDTYRCTFAGHAIALAECGAYRYTFDTATSTPTITDPTTGEQVDWSAQPQTGNSISPGTGPGTGTNPAAECFAAGWAAFNPIEWVLTPVKCALVWAFVPRSTVVDAGFASIDSRWQTTAVGGLATAVASWSFVAPSSSGCSGITVGISELGHDIEDFQILNACAGEPLQPIAALSTLVIGIGAVLTAIAAVTGSVGGIVGQRPLAAGSGS